jgi:hypothetical protein
LFFRGSGIRQKPALAGFLVHLSPICTILDSIVNKVPNLGIEWYEMNILCPGSMLENQWATTIV